MRVKTAPCLRPQPARSSCHALASVIPITKFECNHSYNLLFYDNTGAAINSKTIAHRQRGAGNGLLALFIVAILVTTIVAALFGHKIGYQRGYHLLQTETKQAAVSNEQSTKELEDLRIKHKILTTQVANAKQELAISLSNLDEMRETQQALVVNSKQVAQLNDIYATVLSAQGGMPLQVLGAKIEPLPENAFEYGFDVGMLSEDGSAKNLMVKLTLQNKDDFIEVPLDPDQFAIEGIVRIRGRFVMPAGFKPLQVKLNLEADEQEVEQLYDWKLGDMVDSIPLTLLDLPEVDKSPIATKKPIATEKSSTTKKNP